MKKIFQVHHEAGCATVLAEDEADALDAALLDLILRRPDLFEEVS